MNAALQDAARMLVSQLGLGSLDGREQVKLAVAGYLSRRGYSVEISSFRDGYLVLTALPPESALLRYDLPGLRQHLKQQLPDVNVRDVKVKTRIFAATS